MSERSVRKPILTARALDELQHARRQIVEAAAGKMPEPLVLATVGTVVQLARCGANPEEILSERILELVRQSMKSLARHHWKPDTALLLPKRREENRHGLS